MGKIVYSFKHRVFEALEVFTVPSILKSATIPKKTLYLHNILSPKIAIPIPESTVSTNSWCIPSLLSLHARCWSGKILIYIFQFYGIYSYLLSIMYKCKIKELLVTFSPTHLMKFCHTNSYYLLYSTPKSAWEFAVIE